MPAVCAASSSKIQSVWSVVSCVKLQLRSVSPVPKLHSHGSCGIWKMERKMAALVVVRCVTRVTVVEAVVSDGAGLLCVDGAMRAVIIKKIIFKTKLSTKLASSPTIIL